MKKWTLVDQALTPDGKTISLHEHDGSYTIRVDGIELMSTRRHGSEEKIAELACAHVRGKRGARVLIGGLGFGSTLKAALATVAADAGVVVAEILGAVIAWNRNASLPLAADAMKDPRVRVVRPRYGGTIRSSRFTPLVWRLIRLLRRLDFILMVAGLRFVASGSTASGATVRPGENWRMTTP